MPTLSNSSQYLGRILLLHYQLGHSQFDLMFLINRVKTLKKNNYDLDNITIDIRAPSSAATIMDEVSRLLEKNHLLNKKNPESRGTGGGC